MSIIKNIYKTVFGNILIITMLCLLLQAIMFFLISMCFDKTMFEIIFKNIFMSFLISITLSIIIVNLIVSFTPISLSKKINDFTVQIKNSNCFSPLNIKKVNIKELDNLADAFEILSNNMIETEKKLSKIIELIGPQIMAFEFNFATNIVYTSTKISDILRIDDKSVYTIEEFKELLIKINDYLIDCTANVKTYKYIDINGNVRCINIRFMEGTLGTAGIIVDVTDEYKEKEKLIRERNYDSLTNIYNRRAFHDKLEQLFMEPELLNIAAFIMIDLDNLKFVNDNFGHDFGDNYIKITASIISKICKKNKHSLYGRRSGDEFYVFLYGYEDKNSLQLDIDTMKWEFGNAYMNIEGYGEVRVRVSGGFSLYPNDTLKSEELIKYADYAMYEVKNTLKGEFKKFDITSYKQNAYLIENEEDLNILIDKELADYHFQPIVDLKNGQIYAYEALMRPLISSFKGPDQILNVAKAQFKLNKIEKLTFFKAMKKYVDNIDIFGESKIFINSIYNQSMSDKDINEFQSNYEDYLTKIIIDFTEHANSNKTIFDKKIEVINRWGCQLALDDYGAGYNGDAQFLEINPNYIKIDMVLIRNIHEDLDKQGLVKNILNYAKGKGIKTIAVGVETEQELNFLVKIDCDYAQGYFFGKPQPLPVEVPQDKLEILQNLKNKN